MPAAAHRPPPLALDAARALVAAQAAPLRPTVVALAEAAGLRLASDAVSDTDLPPFDTSSMDGYAVRCADLAGEAPLPVAFEAAAGLTVPPLPPGAAARIFTGAPLPIGADAVVPQESATVHADGTVSLAPAAPGYNVRFRRGVLSAGATVGRAGDLVTPQRLAVLAAAGCSRISVIPRPRIAIVVTGDELVPASEIPPPGAIRDANGPMLHALATGAATAVTGTALVGDELTPIVTACGTGLRDAEILVVSGGVSVGDHDLVPAAIAQLGGEVLFHRVAVQPGKPVIVARIGAAWVVGLPGNPVSVLVSWRMFVRPLIEALAGEGGAFGEQPLVATLSGPAVNPGDRTQLRPAVLEAAWGGLGVRVLPWHGSHDVATVSYANALVRIEAGAELAAGDAASVFPLPWTLTP